jgi:predicted choloylglycine hydrolase
MQLTFAAVNEEHPGDGFQRIFKRAWPHYSKWWRRDGEESRPSYLASRRSIGTHMPEMLRLYDRLCELVGGGDQEARFLSLYCPPAYLTGCSQAVWPGSEPLLVRNYDYSPRAFDALVLRTRWLGERTVMGMSDCLIGLLDGINDAGLAVSLTFGGERMVGEGFGIPIVIRYVLETCETTAQAAATLARVPLHMAYNVTALDAKGKCATVMIAPGRKAVVTDSPVATNHQAKVAWRTHARATASVERERFLLRRLTLHPEPADRFIAAFLRPPLYSTAFERGFGTLYTSEFWPRRRSMTLHWPNSSWPLQLDHFIEGQRSIRLVD